MSGEQVEWLVIGAAVAAIVIILWRNNRNDPGNGGQG
jgi:hypothetical protein